MRIFSVPAALFLAYFLFTLLPAAARWVEAAIAGAYRRLLPPFTRKSGKVDEAPALLCLLLLLGGVCALLCAAHPVAAALLMTPLFTGLAHLPACARTKDELDAGKYTQNIPEYEAVVRRTCASIAPAFVSGVCVPLLLCAVGMPLHLGCSLGWMYTALLILRDKSRIARRIVALLLRTGNGVLRFLLVLCSGLAGRNPLRTHGRDASTRLMSILGIAGDGTDTHPPMSGDITQAIFICSFCAWLLCLLLTIVGFVFC